MCEFQAMELYPKYLLDVEIVQQLVGGLGRFISPIEPDLKEKEKVMNGNWAGL